MAHDVATSASSLVRRFPPSAPGPVSVASTRASSFSFRDRASERPATEAAVSFEHVSLAFDEHEVLRDLSFEIPAGHMTILVGASGSGKSVVLKLILGLLKPDAGSIRVHGTRIDNSSESQLSGVRDGIGMLFQESALFDSLTVDENVGYKLYEEGKVSRAEARARVEEVLALIGLEAYADRLPSELSGGQRRRVAIARAIAARPRLLLFDEPTSGLDPITAKTVDAEILKLRDLEHVTSLLVTHQLQDAFYIATHEAIRQDGRISIVPAGREKREETTFMVLRDGGIYFTGHASAFRASNDPYLTMLLSDWVPPLVA